ncbi:hypothetical protein ASD64_11280 [Mesorhizobium sp. Root157]|uniref:hypothetical protein n=1 Tax=Mesorhizobium sp. Root157 TaxID=1736477 RepID=UPI0006F7A9D6|nr:hypothetical protein [Mesorhizobium sp. Root157]KQZ80867.1 hypothetical protein ASD64_11280 [Mesorhizobium sp. Root157]
MEHIAALLLIVGCSADLSQCRELSAPVTIFETAEECAATQTYSLRALSGQAERVLGKCIALDPALEEDYAELFWSIGPDGKLDASVETATVVASNGVRPEKDYLSQE